MHWFGGSIAEAVTLSKQKNAIFVVFVEGDNDLSTEMTATIDDAAVVSRLSDQTNFLAVKLKSGTTNYTHFAQIYQFVPVPSLFFIGRNGTPLEVVCAGVQADNLATRIDRILAQHHGEKPPGMPAASSSAHGAQESMGLLQAEANAGAPPPTKEDATATATPSPPKIPKTSPPDGGSKDYEVVCDGDVCVRRPKASDMPSTSQAPVAPVAPDTSEGAPAARGAPPSVTPATVPPTSAPEPPLTTPSQASSDDKLERAKELIEAKRREKAEKEKELERQKELERRNLGQGVVELKRWQADQEMKQIQEDRKREKLENNLARQRILEQIAQDRAERRARDNPPAPAPTPAPVQNTSPQTSGDAGSSARIQFKMPDGTSHTAHFDAEDTLGQVQRYVADNFQMASESFSLWTAFPRRSLTDASARLRELELAPSAALLVLPTRTPASPPASAFSVYTFITQFLSSYILEPSLAVFTWVRLRLFPPPAVGPRSPSPPPATAGLPRGGPFPRKRTNIHRLPGDAPNDDDNNTWNGNSTQQM